VQRLLLHGLCVIGFVVLVVKSLVLSLVELLVSKLLYWIDFVVVIHIV